jgi:hypothetical protein
MSQSYTEETPTVEMKQSEDMHTIQTTPHGGIMSKQPASRAAAMYQPTLLAGLILALGTWACDMNEREGVNTPGKDAQVSDSDKGVAQTDKGKPPMDLAASEGATDLSDATTAPDSCTPQTVDCTGRCGPFKDPCDSHVTECGGCNSGLVCELFTHQCITPLSTCQDLGALCGTIRNSCGDRLDCGTCPDGQECDPDTNTCIACNTAITCQDLGYQCGSVWLGCGPTTNLTPCGSCTDAICNPYLRICEPSCSPAPAPDICAAAKLAKGVECGQITDGCGGLVDCGQCPEGSMCGTGGVANRCEPVTAPTECIAASRECGTIASACGKQITCGTCKSGDVCNPNGKCGPPCQPKTCAVDFASQCGQQLDDGCSSTIKCDCAPGYGCNAAGPGTLGTCVALSTCATYSANGGEGETCSNGASPTFPQGDGKNLSCPCTNNRLCINNKTVVSGETVGSCCSNTATCAGASTCTVPNSCTAAPINCCGSNQYCEATNTCANFKTCSTYTTRLEGAPCSAGPSPAFPRGDGVNLQCPCSGADLFCTDGAGHSVAGATVGTCCHNTTTCAGTNACSVVNSCTGAAISCCGPTQYCDTASNTCKDLSTCATFGANGDSGNPCSNGASPIFPAGNGTNLTCRCDSGIVCINASNQIVSGSDDGTCCQNTASCTGATTCTVANTCTMAAINCCKSTEYCDTGLNSCALKNTCTTYSANGNINDPCSTVKSTAFPVGDGTGLLCNCSTASNKQNNKCFGSNASAAGKCECTPNVCDCANTGTSNGCGQIMSCPCNPGEQCNTNSKTCYVPQTCASYGANGNENEPCSTVQSSAFPVGSGANLLCNCSTANGWDNNVCVGSSASQAGTCQCARDTCRGRVGNYPDLCGGSITCNG